MIFNEPYVAPTLTVDIVIFRLNNGQIEVLLTKRLADPFSGMWALPGGYCPKGDTTKNALMNIVKRKIGIDINSHLSYLEQLYTFDTVARDPRGHAVSVTYYGFTSLDDCTFKAEQISQFFPISEPPKLAFDHKDIINIAYNRLKSKITYTNLITFLLPEKITLTQLQKAYEIILKHPLDKRNFRKKIASINLVEPISEYLKDGAHRPARLYSFTSQSLNYFNTNQF